VTYRVELSEAAYDDLTRLYGFILERDPNDFALAEEALDAIKAAFKILQLMPYSFRMAKSSDPFLRELVMCWRRSNCEWLTFSVGLNSLSAPASKCFSKRNFGICEFV